ncbi:hypothetical protein [Burkholderia sp. Bp8991]|uniref:hypothetical protein n=1 Tax=Burkholderia sp. Bp8991 TaxID=2184553 RepID=UPI000F5A1C08|nr:hypothetical protein [Burkholderia sp. Bp8991]
MKPLHSRRLALLGGVKSVAWLLVCASAHAQTSGPFELKWTHPGEKLVYQSRGCADECWEAAVVNKRTGVLLARLRCDGTDLPLTLRGYRPAATPSQVDLGDCSPDSWPPDGVNKFEAIPAEFERLLRMP